ncbi:actin-like ATPase domain-containing protein [Crucibulum laeve]|uniref:Actin-like ATPase domain-containing protein n=1 Tax=Crucibulum laeve TaxID=68775 RepID=A0A5C3M398_9AGAR|nr:actin-like ATPase domain-containing protein [Crucibulum laeve]
MTLNADTIMSDASNDAHNITRLPTPQPPAIPPSPLSYDAYRSQHTPIVIDNGSTTLRWGFGDADAPFTGPNVIAKYKERKSNKPLLLFGEGIDVESGARAQSRTPWEGDVLLNFDALENALDFAFVQLGIDTPTVEHPVLMSERLSTPLHSRTLTSELMFELYSVPSVAYCVDGIMSFYQNSTPQSPFTSDGLVVSFNTASTSIIPILSGKGVLSQAKRIPWGASQTSEYLLKLIQLKYPNFGTRVTTMQTNWMLHNFCEFAPDYPSLLRSLKDPLALRASERIVQFPFALPVVEEKTEEELARITEKRREQGRRLQEIAAKSRIEKLARKETDLQHLTNLREGKGGDSKREWINKLQTEGFDDEASLDQTIKKLEMDVKKARKKDAGPEDEVDEEPTFPLVDVPDADLDEEGLKEKKKQKLMKAGFEARARARKEKEREREEKEREEKKEEEEREADLGGWSRKLRQEQENLMSRIKERARRKAALSDRKSAAAQARMKSIANLAADDRVPKKKRKGGGEDMFGADDADWAIYRKINTAVESSDEEEDLNQLQAVEQKLLQYDPTFTPQETHASIASQRSALISAFRPLYDEGDIEGNARIHLNTERWRVCEAYFSPGMAGVDSAGLGEVIQNVLGEFSEAEKGRLVKNVFLTGSPSQFPGLIPRLHAAMRPILPPEMPLEIMRAADPVLDAWKGMAAFSRTEEFAQVGVTKAQYEEYGGERIKRWWGGNWNGGTIA